MELTDFILCAQRVNPQASISLELHPEKNTLTICWSWKGISAEDSVFKRAMLIKELNYDEAITVFLTRCQSEIENGVL